MCLTDYAMRGTKEYYAFISYKREDEKWAKWLQHKLEYYRFPTNLNGRPDLPKYIRPTFRDVTDLNPGLLSEEINKALRGSEWLIVICSPRSAKSPWVCKEAQTFIELGRADHIIPFVIEGKPFSNDATECYPKALLNLLGCNELLAANINEMGRDAAAIKVIARMFDIRFDILWQRHRREENAQKQKLKEEKRSLQIYQGRVIASIARSKIAEGNVYLAARLCSFVFPTNLNRLNRAYVAEVAGVLREIYDIFAFSLYYTPVHRWRNPIFNHHFELYVSNEGDYLGIKSEWQDSIDFIRVKDGVCMPSLNCTNIDFSHNGRYFAVSTDIGFEIRDIITWKIIKKEEFKLEQGLPLKSISYSSDDKYLVLTAETSVLIYNIEDSTYYEIFDSTEEFFSPIRAVMNHTMSQIAVLDVSAELTLFDIKGNKIASFQFEDLSTDITNPFLFFSEDDSVLFFYSTNSFLQSYDINKATELVCANNEKELSSNKDLDLTNLNVDWYGYRAFPFHEIDIHSIVTSSFKNSYSIPKFDSLVKLPPNMLAGSFGGGNIMFLKKGDLQRKSLFLHSHNSFKRCEFIQDSSLVICSIILNNGYSTEIEIWDYKKKLRKYRIPSISNESLVNYDYDNKEKILYLSYRSGLIIGWDVNVKNVVYKYNFDFPTPATTNDFPFSESDGNILQDMRLLDDGLISILTFPSSDIKVLDIKHEKEYKLGTHSAADSLLFLKEKKILLSISKGGDIVFWSIKLRKKIGELLMDHGVIEVINCGKNLCAVLLSSAHLALVNIKSMKLIKKIDISCEGQSIIYNPDNCSILVLKPDYTIAEYSAMTLSFLYSFNMLDYMPSFKQSLFEKNFCLTPDGNYIVVNKWKFKLPRINEVYKPIMNRFSKLKLSQDEMHDYYLD